MSKNPFETQVDSDDEPNKGVWVGVRSGEIDRKTGKMVASDFLIEDKVSGKHIHIGLDEYGETIFESRRSSNRKKK